MAYLETLLLTKGPTLQSVFIWSNHWIQGKTPSPMDLLLPARIPVLHQFSGGLKCRNELFLKQERIERIWKIFIWPQYKRNAYSIIDSCLKRARRGGGNESWTSFSWQLCIMSKIWEVMRNTWLDRLSCFQCLICI